MGKALEKDRDFRRETGAEIRADLKRLKRDVDSSGRLDSAGRDPEGARGVGIRKVRRREGEKDRGSLYFENLSGSKEMSIFAMV